jgi:hypothetical protein
LRQKRPFAEPSIGQPSEGILRRRLWLCFGTDTAAKTAASLDTMFPEKTPALKFRNPVLSAFANAVLQRQKFQSSGLQKTAKGKKTSRFETILPTF